VIFSVVGFGTKIVFICLAETMVQIAKSLQGLNSNLLTPEQEYRKNILKVIIMINSKKRFKVHFGD
jgi:hypothetical protein